MGKGPTNLLPPGVFKDAAEKKSDVGVLKPLQFVKHDGQPGVVFRTTMRNEQGNIEAVNSFASYKDLNSMIDKLMTDHLPHEKLDQNLATLREARADLKGISEMGFSLPTVSNADILRMSPLDKIADSLKYAASSEAKLNISPPIP